MPKLLTTLAAVAAALLLVWYLLLYPGELWIRYNLAFRSDSHEEFADYVQNQSDFETYRCEHDRVYVDNLRRASPMVTSTLLEHCENTGLSLGRKIEFGAWFHTGTLTKWRDDYAISILRLANIPDDTVCPRIPSLQPNEDCIFVIDGRWVIHYWRASEILEKAEENAEDVERYLQEKEQSPP